MLEPVTLDEAKAHLRVDTDGEDALISSLILTSRLQIEAALGLGLVTQSWRLVRDAWPADGIVEVPIRPLLAVNAVQVLDAAGGIISVPASDYIVDVSGVPPRIAPAGKPWPAPGRTLGGIEISVTVGFGAAASDVPAPIRQALLVLVAHWYEHRDPHEAGAIHARIPEAVCGLLDPYRLRRLK